MEDTITKLKDKSQNGEDICHAYTAKKLFKGLYKALLEINKEKTNNAREIVQKK